ncbi:hypothetical protein [Nodosilinea nodulosa]|nr:hypothetical protein [Nodosilinea nodulosa]
MVTIFQIEAAIGFLHRAILAIDETTPRPNRRLAPPDLTFVTIPNARYPS